MHTARIDSRHAYKQSGPTFGFNGILRLELRDQAPPGAIACARVGTSSAFIRKLAAAYKKSGITLFIKAWLVQRDRLTALMKSLPAACERPSRVAHGFKVLTPSGLRYILWCYLAGSLPAPQLIEVLIKIDNDSSKAAPQTHGTSEVLEVVQGPRAVFPDRVPPQKQQTSHEPQMKSGVVRRVLSTLLIVAMVWTIA